MKHVVFVALLALPAACVENAPNAPGLLRFVRITPPYGREFSGLREPGRLVIRDTRAFAELWKRAYGAVEPAPPVPDVDFARDMVVVVAMGEQRSGGYAIEVADVVASGGGWVVNVKSMAPGPDCAVHTALTQPLDMVKVPALKGMVEFHDQTATTRCG